MLMYPDCGIWRIPPISNVHKSVVKFKSCLPFRVRVSAVTFHRLAVVAFFHPARTPPDRPRHGVEKQKKSCHLTKPNPGMNHDAEKSLLVPASLKGRGQEATWGLTGGSKIQNGNRVSELLPWTQRAGRSEDSAGSQDSRTSGGGRQWGLKDHLLLVNSQN